MQIIVFQDNIHQLIIANKIDETNEHISVIYPTVLNLQKEPGTGRLTAALIPILPEQLTVGDSPVWQYPLNRVVLTKNTTLAPNLIKSYTDMYQAATKAITPVPEAQTPAKLF